MDGNGRWAAQRHLPRVEGHRAGIASVRDVVEASARIGIEVLTLYAFSVENWKRPRAEVATLMTLLKRYLRLELGTLIDNNIRFQVIGRQDELAARHPRRARRGRCGGRPTNTGMQFNIALNYGGRAEIVDAARRAIAAGHRARGPRRAPLRGVPLHGRPARSRPPDPHERRDAREQLPALADRVRGNLGHRHALARLPAPRHLLEAVLAFQKRERRYGGIKPSRVAIGAVTPSSERRGAPGACSGSAAWWAPPAAARRPRRASSRAGAVIEFARLAERARRPVPARPAHRGRRAVLHRRRRLARRAAPLRSPIAMAVVVRWRGVASRRCPRPTASRRVAAPVFGALYLGLPLGALMRGALDVRAARRCCC